MGFYINELEDGTPLPKIGKAQFLLDNISPSSEWTDLPATFDDAAFGHNNAVIAVVENGLFDAAGYVDERLFTQIKYEQRKGPRPHIRPVRFVCINRKLATKLSGIDEYLKA